MKSSNKYAQLIETQSPEPKPDELDDNFAEIVGQDSNGAQEVNPETRQQHEPEGNRLIGSSNNETISSSSSYQTIGELLEGQEAAFASEQTAPAQARSNSFIHRHHDDGDDELDRGDTATSSSKSFRQIGSQVVGENVSASHSSVCQASKNRNYKPINMTNGQFSISINSLASYKQAPESPATSQAAGEAKDDDQVTISKSMLQLDQSIEEPGGFQIEWKRLSFEYGGQGCFRNPFRRNQHQGQPILNNISGSIKSNQLVAVIGPSGCGKTTLLQILAGNNEHAKERLRIGGLKAPKIAFIGQDDALLPGLTARETLLYASELQNCNSTTDDSPFNHQEHIETVLKNLNLLNCADRSVTKLSGGQAKRVTIGQELLYPTNLLILDEITSGLDASTSYSIVRLLKELVSDRRYPMSIVMSIHQPSAKLFSIFDKVYVMSNGCCLYEGETNINAINNYLKQFQLSCPPYNNIADYLIEIASVNSEIAGNSEQDNFILNAKQQMVSFQEKRALVLDEGSGDNFIKEPIVLFDNEDLDQEIGTVSIKLLDNQPNATSLDASTNLYDSIEYARGKRVQPILKHFSIHFRRSILRIRRSHILTYLQFLTYILLGLQLSTFYGTDIGTLSGCPKLSLNFANYFLFSSSSKANDEDDKLNSEMRRIQENMNFLLVAIMTATFAALEITVITFPLEARTIKREWRNGWYQVSSYFLGRTMADLPFQMSFVMVFCALIYLITGQSGNGSLWTWRFGSFVLIIVMSALIAQSVGFIFGAIFMNNLPAAVFTAPLFIFPALLFSGFFARVSQIPHFYKPFTYLSHFRYAFEALLVTLYGFNRCDCNQENLDYFHISSRNQTGSLRDIYGAIFGLTNNCAPTLSNHTDPEDGDDFNAIEESSTVNDFDLIKTTTTTAIPVLSNTNHTSTTFNHTNPIASLEEAIVDTVFEHMKGVTSTSGDQEISCHTESCEDVLNITSTSASDMLIEKFSTKLTTMLNSRANFGHQIPTQCQDFNPYLITEFNLQNDDLLFGLAMLFLFVIFSRLLCNAILTITIATRR